MALGVERGNFAAEALWTDLAWIWLAEPACCAVALAGDKLEAIPAIKKQSTDRNAVF